MTLASSKRLFLFVEQHNFEFLHKNLINEQNPQISYGLHTRGILVNTPLMNSPTAMMNNYGKAFG